MGSAFCDWAHMVNMQFQSRWTSSYLAAIGISADNDSAKVLPKWWVSRLVIKYLENLLITGSLCIVDGVFVIRLVSFDKLRQVHAA